MEKHFAIINKKTNVVRAIISTGEDTCYPSDECYEIEIAEHNPDIWGKKYIDGEFVEVIEE